MADCPEELISNRFIHFEDIHVISAKNEIGIDNVQKSIREVLDQQALKQQQRLNDAKKEEQRSN